MTEPAKKVLTRRRLAPLTVCKVARAHPANSLRCFTIRQIGNYPTRFTGIATGFALFSITDFLTGKKRWKSWGNKSRWEHTRSNYFSSTMGGSVSNSEITPTYRFTKIPFYVSALRFEFRFTWPTKKYTRRRRQLGTVRRWTSHVSDTEQAATEDDGRGLELRGTHPIFRERGGNGTEA